MQRGQRVEREKSCETSNKATNHPPKKKIVFTLTFIKACKRGCTSPHPPHTHPTNQHKHTHNRAHAASRDSAPPGSGAAGDRILAQECAHGTRQRTGQCLGAAADARAPYRGRVHVKKSAMMSRGRASLSSPAKQQQTQKKKKSRRRKNNKDHAPETLGRRRCASRWSVRQS